MNRRQFLLRAGLGLGGLALAGKGCIIEPNSVKESYHQIETDKLDQRVRIVHISDIHMDISNPKGYVPQMINNRDPDLILMTGDYVNDDGANGNLDRLKRFMDQLKPKKGTYASFGNWDEGLEEVLFEGTKVVPLFNSSIQLDELNMNLVGLEYTGGHWIRGEFDDLVDGLDEKNYNVLLQHSPDHFEDVKGKNIDLYLAGHTHGGQVKIPFLGLFKGTNHEFPFEEAIYIDSRNGLKYSEGLFADEGTIMYVNRGLGMSEGIPIRFMSLPEIATFDIGPKDQLPIKQYNSPSNL